MAEAATITTNIVSGTVVAANVTPIATVTANVITGAAGPAGATGATGPGVPTGGTTGQVLAKTSGVDYDAIWTTGVTGLTSQYKTTLTVGFSNADYIVDGSADNVQFQQAIDALTALGGGTLWFKAPVISGTVYDFVQRVIILSPNILVKGTFGAVIKMHANADQEAFVVGNGFANDTIDSGPVINCHNTFFEDVVIDGNKANQTVAASWTGGARYATSATRNLIRWRSDAQNSYGGGARNCYVYNGIQNGLSCESHAQGSFINNRAENMDQNGMWSENGSNWTIVDNHTRNNGQDTAIGGYGIKFASFGGLVVMGNSCKGERGGGISLQSSGQGTVANNSIYRAGWQAGVGDNPAVGIFSSLGANLAISGNAIYAAQGHGLWLNGNTSTSVTGNTFRRNGQYADNTYSDIYMTYEGGGDVNRKCTFIGNTFQNDTATFYTNKVKYNIGVFESATGHAGNSFWGNTFGAPGTAVVDAGLLAANNTWGPHDQVNPQAVYSYGYFSNPTQTIDPKNGNVLEGTGYNSTVAVTIANGVAAGQQFTFIYAQDTGNKQLTWAANVKWPGGTAPTFLGTASTQDHIIFTWDGTNWNGVWSGNQALLSLKAPLASPALTGTPTGPTASALTNNTQLATTAYADSAITTERTATRTLSGARVTLRTSTTASSATPTPNGDTDDRYTVTALAAAATFGAPTGTPTDGQKLIIRVKDNGTAQTLAFNAIYRFSSDLAAPTTTVLSKTLYMGFAYNAADSKWDCLAILNNF